MSFRFHRATRKVGLVLLASVAAALVLEGALRWTVLGDRFYYQAPAYIGEHPNRASASFQADENVGWRMRPGAQFSFETDGRQVPYEADERGFRTGPGRDLEGRTKRIAWVGDSFAWGFGLPWGETAVSHVEAALPSCRVDVLGMPGFGVDQIAQSVRHWALPSDPDLVIALIYSDDLSRCFTAYRDKEGFNKPLFRLEDGRLVRGTEEDQPGAVRRFLERRTRLFGLGWSVVRVLGKRFGVGPWWNLNRALIDQMVDDLRANEKPVLFVHIPKRSWSKVPALGEHLRDRGAPLIDLTELSDEPMDELYFETDDHLGPLGNRFLADQIIAWIRENAPGLI